MGAAVGVAVVGGVLATYGAVKVSRFAKDLKSDSEWMDAFQRGDDEKCYAITKAKALARRAKYIKAHQARKAHRIQQRQFRADEIKRLQALGIFY